MAEAILYCDRCARLVPPSDLESGGAVRTGNAVFCAACASTLPARPRTPAPRAPARRTTPARGAKGVNDRGRPSPVPLFLAVLAGSAVVASLVTALLVGGDSGQAPTVSMSQPKAPPRLAAPVVRSVPAVAPPPSPAAPESTPAVPTTLPAATAPPAAEETPAGAELDRIRDLVDPTGSRLDEIRRLVDAYVAAHPQSPESAEARTLLAETERSFVTQAESNLKSAMDQANALLERGMYDQAARSFTYVKMLYGTSAWYGGKAKSRIDEALARIVAAKEKFATAGIAFRDEFTEAAATSWEMPAGWVASDGALAAASQGTAIAPLPAGGVVTAEALVEVKRREGGGHTAAGLVIQKDGSNFWYLGLCEAPDGPRYAEFHESLNGQWMAQLNSSKLTVTSSGDIGWDFNTPYRLVIELRKDRITGIIKDVDGNERSRTTFTFDNDAVRTGRPGLTARSCVVAFDDFSARVVDAGTSD